MQYKSFYTSPLGRMVMASDGEALTGLWFEGQKYMPRLEGMEINEGLKIFEEVRRWLDDYFEDKEPRTMPRLNPQGTVFRLRVWNVLMGIPYGQIMTYGDVARRVAGEMGVERMSAQAVGGAIGHNPISILIPCHRVVGANGELVGYAGGVERKRWLLFSEG